MKPGHVRSKSNPCRGGRAPRWGTPWDQLAASWRRLAHSGWLLALASLGLAGTAAAGPAGPGALGEWLRWHPQGAQESPDSGASAGASAQDPAPNSAGETPDRASLRSRAEQALTKEPTLGPTQEPNWEDWDFWMALRDDVDPSLRALWVRWVERLERAGWQGEARFETVVEGMIEALRQEWDPAVRKALVERLTHSSHPRAQVWIALQWRRGDPALSVALARSVRPGPAHQALIRGTLREWAQVGSVDTGFPALENAAHGHLASGVLVELLPHYGTVMADAPPSDVQAQDVWPVVVALHHPDETIAQAGALALQTWIDRLVEREDPAHMQHHLAALERGGVDRRILRFEEARLAFHPLADGPLALRSAKALLQVGGGRGWTEQVREEQTRRWRFRSLYLEGMAQLAIGDAHSAQRAFQTGLRSNREALQSMGASTPGPDGEPAPRHLRETLSEILQERILLLIGECLSQGLAGLADPAGAAELPLEQRVRLEPSVQMDCLRALEAAHRLHLEVQVLHAGLTGQALSGWDGLFDHRLSPYRLLLHGRAFPGGLGVEDQLALEWWLGRGLASVSAQELPGLRPWEAATRESQPQRDLVRRARLLEIHWAKVEHLSGELDRVQDRIDARQRSPLGQVPEEEVEAYSRLALQHRMALRTLESFDGRGVQEPWVEVRIAGGHSLRLARGLRAAGRLAEARTLIERYVTDLETDGIGTTWYYLGQEQLARADLELGANLSDDEQPREAETALLRGATRLQGILDRLEEVGASEASMRPYRDQLASAWVSLAVNANVRLGEPKRALEFYEKAYALKQDAFMRVLLACYRARSGHAAEARALLASVTPTPPLYYNLACTYALLGDADQAFHWLRLELAPGRMEPAALARQKQWARQDPDLVSLRGLPEFERLLAP